MAKNKIVTSVGFIVGISMIIVASGCKSCFNTGSDSAQRIETCEELNNKPEECNQMMQKDAKRCEYDVATGVCKANQSLPPTNCNHLTFNECKGSKYCTFKDTLGECGDADPALKGKCEVIQVEEFCSADPACEWNKMAVVCQQRELK